MAAKKTKPTSSTERQSGVIDKSAGSKALKTHSTESPGEKRDALFPVVGIGASAGGLEAFEQFFGSMPSDSGMAFALVSHLDPGHESMLTEILQRVTKMPVVEAKDQMKVEPNHVYVIPPNRDMTIFHMTLQVSIPEKSRGQRMPIDNLLRSLAEEQGENSIGIILSGTGSDGTLGLRAILGAGGVSFVQEPSTAKYDGMPSSAVQSNLATYVLPINKMTEQLMVYVKTLIQNKIRPVFPKPVVASNLKKIMMTLRSRTGHDFSLYKQSTIKRRIERRMSVHNIEAMDVYARYLQEHPEEVHDLFKELLINVTSFFRDPEAFTVLKKEILPRLFEKKPDNYVFRVWSPGCSTGEEAFSLAMSFREYMDDIKQDFKVQIYGTDIDEEAIAAARSGVYPPNISIDVSQERLRRFFIKEDTGFRIKKDIREMVIFATQNVVKDPPFTKLDMLSCRNLLIYLEPELQNKLLPIFHYALKPGGILFLSSSEGIGSFHDFFVPLSKKWRLYETKKSLVSARTAIAGNLAINTDHSVRLPVEAALVMKGPNFAELTKMTLLQLYAPASVVTDEKGNVLYVHGDTGKYLRPAPGHASLNVIDMAREGLQLKLRTAIHSAASHKKVVDIKGMRVKTNGGFSEVNLTIRPFTELLTTEALLIICFQEAEVKAKGKTALPAQPAVRGQAKRIGELEQELMYTKENLRATIEEMQASNEELKSTNEELQSTNEELQSTNEEIETSKEELQSVNEELMTVNAELQAKIEQLARMQNDMKNLLESTDIGTIFLDTNLKIKQFAHESAAVFRLAAGDIGRPLSDIKSNIIGEDLIADAQAVLDSLIPREKQVQTTNKLWYLVRVMPYRTFENVIDGIVFTFTNITVLKNAEEKIQKARDYAENIVDTIREPLVILDAGLKVVSASRSFYELFRLSPDETKGQYIYNISNRQWDISRLRELLEAILPDSETFDNYEIECDIPVIGRRKMQLNARRISGEKGETELILLAMENVTEKGK
ncbi:MAG: PAS domain-containing protein [Nitrospiraceae bacterium]|nr:MAG: PAS domain-containing protein [Nitrospiraceae bacterium]